MFGTEPWQPCGSSLGKNCRQRNCSARAANRSLGMVVRKGGTGMGGRGKDGEGSWRKEGTEQHGGKLESPEEGSALR